MDLTLYLVGATEDDAQSSMPFDSHTAAQSYANDNGGLPIWTVTARIDFSTVERVEP